MVGRTNITLPDISENCTATKDKILSGYTTIANDSNNEIVPGTMPNNGAVSQSLNCGGSYTIPIGFHNGSGKIAANSLSSQTSATATTAKILNGYTAWVNGSKITGNVVCNSILNFNAAAYSTTQILLQWQNPYAATGRPFSGVFINYSTGGYPGTGGTRIYTGYGNNNIAGGWSQAIVNMPSAGTGYYFSCTAYCSCNTGDLWGNTINAYAATTSHGSTTFTWSQTWTVPAGIRSVDVCCVGGGGGGGGGKGAEGGKSWFGGGGGGGYVNNWYGIAVTPAQQIGITIGAGGKKSGYNNPGNGNTSSFGGFSAGGGGGAHNGDWGDGGSGGSGAGSGGPDIAYPGGSNGGDGQGPYHGYGQGSSTKAFSGTLYAGGGAGVWAGSGKNWAGGAGGGGPSNQAGSPNTGGGGGGGNNYYYPGGSGTVIVRW